MDNAFGDDDLVRLALDLAPVAIVVADDDGRIVLVNRQTEQLLGYDRLELIDRQVETLVPSRFRRAHARRRDTFLEAPETRPMGNGRDLFALRKDGAEVPVEIGLNPVRTRAGLLVVTSVIDLTERRRAEARFQAAVESAPSGFLMVDGSGTIVLANREAERTFRYQPGELDGMAIEQLVPERFRTDHPAHRQHYLSSPQARPMGTGRELFGTRKDGGEVPVEVGLTPLTTEEGTFVLASVVDITMRRNLEAQLREAQRLETVGALASGIAHDFNNVLLAIAGYAELVLDNEGLEASTRYDVGQVVKAADRGRQVVDRMLQIGRQRPGNTEPSEIGAVVGEALDLLNASMLKSVEVRRHLDPDTPAVLCDTTHIHQIVMNLGSNAARAMRRPDGVLDVSLVPFNAGDDSVAARPDLPRGLYARLTIADNGVGIPRDIRGGKVFEPFFTTDREGKGTGLGLWLVRDLVHGMQGAIEIRSREGEGTAIDIFLPAADPERERDIDSAADELRAPHVIYVDDDEPLAELGRRRLESAGFRVTVFTSSVQALERIQARPAGFDLLVTDNSMPRLSGLELAEEAQRIHPGVPVLMVSGLAQMRLEDVPPYVARVLPKPHSAEQLVEAVQQLLGEV